MEKLAANAVLAGCLPEYFPVVIAVIEALPLPRFNLAPEIVAALLGYGVEERRFTRVVEVRIRQPILRFGRFDSGGPGFCGR